MKQLKDPSIGFKYSVDVRNKYASLMEQEEKQDEDVSVETQWKYLKHGILESLEENFDVVDGKEKEEWITDEILFKMDREGRVRMTRKCIDS